MVQQYTSIVLFRCNRCSLHGSNITEKLMAACVGDFLPPRTYYFCPWRKKSRLSFLIIAHHLLLWMYKTTGNLLADAAFGFDYNQLYLTSTLSLSIKRYVCTSIYSYLRDRQFVNPSDKKMRDERE